jgi:hypothetical protein
MNEHATISSVNLTQYPTDPIRDAWLECLAHAKLPCHFASPAFFHEPYFRAKSPFAILAMKDDRVIGVLTGLYEPGEVRSGLTTRVQLAVDSRYDSAETFAVIARALLSKWPASPLVAVYDWGQAPLGHPELHKAATALGLRIKQFPGAPVLDLSLGADTLLKQMKEKRRYNIRQAMKGTAEVFEATTDSDYDAFCDISESWSAEMGLSPFPRDMEHEAFSQTRANRLLLLARDRVSGKTIAGTVFRFYPGGLVEYSRNVSLSQYEKLRPNELLMWRGIEWACANGFSKFSMGANHRFLRQFGGTTEPITRYRLDRSFLRRHDRKENAIELCGKLVRKMPAGFELRVRKLLGKEIPAGW